MNARLFLAKGREKSLLRRHPWIFSGAISRIEGHPAVGETVSIHDFQGNYLAYAAFSPHSQIQARVWTFNNHENINVSFFIQRLQRAQQWRDYLVQRDNLTAYRLIAGESDGMPGITIDRYQNVIVLQLLSAGAEYQRANLIIALQTCYPECSIYDRSDVAVRKKEGLPLTQGLIHGDVPPDFLTIREHRCQFLVDIKQGHKTGFYLDQRDSRLAAQHFSHQARVLNCFSYTGAFAISTLIGGCTQVINVDSSQAALDVARENVILNRLDLDKAEFIQEDVFQLLRQYDVQTRNFDLIIMDPPKFIENKSQLSGACRGYKDINRLALKLLKPGGILMSFSCSGLMPTALFQKILADAALDAKRDIQFIEQYRQAADHPVVASYPEGYYLKGFACRVA